jgi:hypothetical protein
MVVKLENISLGFRKVFGRFLEGGISASLKVKAWVVVDFRANKTGLPTQIEANILVL